MPAHWCLVMTGILDYQGPDFYLTMNQLKENIYKKNVKDDPECHNLHAILRYLVASSQIIWIEKNETLCDYIFNSPQQIVEICKRVLDHDQASRFVQEWVDERSDASIADKCKNFLKDYKTGILSEQLLKKLLSSHQEKDVNLIINFLQHFNLLSEMHKHKSSLTKARTFVIPSNLPEEDPEGLQVVEQRCRKCPVNVCVALSFLGDMVPKSFFETSLSSMLTIANELSEEPSDTDHWRHGLYICHDGVYCIVTRLDTRVTVTAGSSYERNPWSVLLPILKALLQNVSSSWPGEPSNCAVLCPACQYLKKTDVGKFKVNAKELLSCQTAAESRGSTNRPCPKCKRFVPRSLCYPVSKDSLFNEKEAIQIFYKSIADESEKLNIDANRKECVDLPQVPAGSAAAGGFGFAGGETMDMAEDDQLSKKLRLAREHIEDHLSEPQVRKRAIVGVTMSSQLRARLRQLSIDITNCLQRENVIQVANIMWAAQHLNKVEKDSVESSWRGFEAASKLIDFTWARGDASIKGFADALKEIGMPDLAQKLCPAAAPSALQ